MNVGRRVPTSWKTLLKCWICLAPLAVGFHLCLGYVVDLIFPTKTPFNWFPSITQGLVFPTTLVLIIVMAEQRLLRWAPRRIEDEASVLEIRKKQDGQVLLTVATDRLDGVSLSGAELASACLWGESMIQANLAQANLQGAVLRAAILDGADLRGAHLRHEDLRGAQLRQVGLRGADLRDAFLDSADLRGALYDAGTKWPARFRPGLRGCIRANEDSTALPIPATHDASVANLLPIPGESAEPRRERSEFDTLDPAPREARLT